MEMVIRIFKKGLSLGILGAPGDLPRGPIPNFLND